MNGNIFSLFENKYEHKLYLLQLFFIWISFLQHLSQSRLNKSVSLFEGQTFFEIRVQIGLAKIVELTRIFIFHFIIIVIMKFKSKPRCFRGSENIFQFMNKFIEFVIELKVFWYLGVGCHFLLSKRTYLLDFGIFISQID